MIPTGQIILATHPASNIRSESALAAVAVATRCYTGSPITARKTKGSGNVSQSQGRLRGGSLVNVSGAGNAAPVCVTGMHRSGTSSTAQLLYWCGLYLGPENELFAAGPANPDGYWENGRFVSINNRILEAFGGGWDLPPFLEPGWHGSEKLAGLRAEAEDLLRGFEGHDGPWGWKDPRNSLTTPFWAALLPDAKYVLCLRNPLEVALSLRKRGNSSLAFGLNLWDVYTRRLMETLPPERYIVTHYESYFYRPMEELRRVLDFIGVHASDQLVSHARSSSLKGLRHQQATNKDLLETPATPSGLPELYARLCEEARWDPERPPALGRAVVETGEANQTST